MREVRYFRANVRVEMQAMISGFSLVSFVPEQVLIGIENVDDNEIMGERIGLVVSRGEHIKDDGNWKVT